MATLQRTLSVEARDLRLGSWNKIIAGLLLRKEQGVGLTRALETRTCYVDGEQRLLALPTGGEARRSDDH